MVYKVTYGKEVEIVVGRATVRDDLNAQIIRGRLKEGVKEGEWGLWDTFGDLCAQTRKSKGLPFDPLHLHEADDKALADAYECFMTMDKDLKDRWVRAVREANRPIDETIAPTPLPEDADPKA